MKKEKHIKLISVLLQLAAAIVFAQVIWLFLPFIRTATMGNIALRTRGFEFMGMVSFERGPFLDLALQYILVPAMIVAVLAAIFIPKAIHQAKPGNSSALFAAINAVLNLGYFVVIVMIPTIISNQQTGRNPNDSLGIGAILSIVFAILAFIIYAAVAVLAAAGPTSVIENKLKELNSLKEQGLITEDDYNNAKTRLLISE